VILVKCRDCLAAKSTASWSGRLMCPGIQGKAHEGGRGQRVKEEEYALHNEFRRMKVLHRNRKVGGINVEREGEKDERDRNRWQAVQPKIWRQSS